MPSLNEWEITFRNKISQIKKNQLQKAGGLLSAIPDESSWHDYLSSVKNEWDLLRRNLNQYPSCLLVLFGGLAYFDYDENTFWPHFETAVGISNLPLNQRTVITQEFSIVSQNLGLTLQRRNRGIAHVGSAVYYIGVPISLWDGFLLICEWAQSRVDWKSIPDSEWESIITKRCGPRTRLKKFLLENREAASSIIKELIDASNILESDKNATIDDIKEICFIRPEYFEAVPETAFFLRPSNPDSLLYNRAKLAWNDRAGQIILRLPGVPDYKQPAYWNIEGIRKLASTTPAEIPLNSLAFKQLLTLQLETSNNELEAQNIKGINSWAIFDFEDGDWVNPERETLPLKSHLVISRKELQVFREGFEETENPSNQYYELTDKSHCFVTRLIPIKKYAEILVEDITKKKIHFRNKSKIESYLFAGEKGLSANFTRHDDLIKIEGFPLICIEIPYGIFKDSLEGIREKFKVYINDLLADGCWVKRTEQPDDEREYFFWKWDEKPFIQKKKEAVLMKSFKELPRAFTSPVILGQKTIKIHAKQFGYLSEYKVEFVKQQSIMGDCWKNLPGDFLPWFLLIQTTKPMKWSALELAKDGICPHLKLSYYYFRKYTDQGYFGQQGYGWKILNSHVVLLGSKGGLCEIQYCGDPSIIWWLYRKLFFEGMKDNFPVIEVVAKRGDLPYLSMKWPEQMRDVIKRHLQSKNVKIVKSLWRTDGLPTNKI